MNDNFWGKHNKAIPIDRLYVCTLVEENSRAPGTYTCVSMGGRGFPDAHLLTPDADLEDGGEFRKPRSGSVCLVAAAEGSSAWILGFARAPKFDENSNDVPVVGDVSDNQVQGDRVFRTTGGATFILKQGGAIVLEAGGAVGITMNPLNGTMSERAKNRNVVTDGYQEAQGRKSPGSTKPETRDTVDHFNQVGLSADRVREQYGDLDGSARSQMTVASVVQTKLGVTGTVKYRETHFADGSCVIEGSKLQLGKGADENAVLGNQLVSALKELIDTIKQLKVGTATGPSTPPLADTQLKLTELENKLSSQILSNFIFLSRIGMVPEPITE